MRRDRDGSIGNALSGAAGEGGLQAGDAEQEAAAA